MAFLAACVFNMKTHFWLNNKMLKLDSNELHK